MKNWLEIYERDIKNAQIMDDVRDVFISAAFNTELEEWEFLKLKGEMIDKYNELNGTAN